MNSNYWWLSINPKMLHFKDLEIDDCFYYTALNEDGTKRTLYKNFLEIKKGEYVIAYESGSTNEVIGICQVVQEITDNKVKFKKVEDVTETVSRYTIECHIELANLEVFRYTQGTLFKLSNREYEVIYSMIRELNPKKQYRYYEKYNEKDFLNDVFMNEKEYNELKSLILRRKNVILEGVPGVGKTYIARKMAYSIIGLKDEEKVLNIQFSESYSCDDFIEGYRPDGIGIYKFKKGCFKRICNKARNDPSNKYFVIIDEINRGNTSKIFGETFSLIDIDKRGKNNYIELSCSHERFYVPENIYIIGTMNPYDTDSSMSDIALRRRFCFYKIIPAFENEKFRSTCANNPIIENLINTIVLINNSLDENLRIGHSYFCKIKDAEDVNLTIKYNLIPYIDNIFKDDCNTKKNLINMLNNSIIPYS